MQYNRYWATDEALAVAKAIADKLGIEFDREGTRLHADRMHDHYFAAIVRTAGLVVPLAVFTAGGFRRVNAFVPESVDGSAQIFFDEQLDFWLYTGTHLVTVMATKQLEGNEVKALVEMFAANLEVPFRPHLHEVNRRRLVGFLFRHADCLEISTALTRAMVVFVICHEIGHVTLGHDKPGVTPTHEAEFAADLEAVGLFIKIVHAGTDAYPIFISQKLTAAPLLLMHLLDVLHLYTRKRIAESKQNRSHPEPRDRAARLKIALEPILADGLYILDGFSKAIEDIARLSEVC